jgi:hypothetical protein
MEVFMKHFSALIATTLIALGTPMGALADTTQCNCACQCETPASPASRSVSPSAIAKPPPPTVMEAPNGELDLSLLGTADATVELTYPEIANGHTAGLYWTSPVQQYQAPVQTVSGGATSVMFKIPNATVIKDVGQAVTLTGSVGVGSAPLVISQPGTVTVINGAPVGQYPPPTVPSATAGQVDLANLDGQPLRVTYTYDGMAAGHTVGIRWAGNPVYETPQQVIGATPRPLEFSIPYEKVRLEKDKTVQLTASVGIGGQLASSAPLSLKVIESLSPGDIVAADLNARYADTSAACNNNAPSYYCNGVTLRAMEYGSGWKPCNVSPSGREKGSQSFSYLRMDAAVPALFRNTDVGMIFLSQEQAIAQGKVLEYLCAYPHDAWTDYASRPGLGCGIEPGRNQPLINALENSPDFAKLLQERPDLLNQLSNGAAPADVLAKTPNGARFLDAALELAPLLQENKANMKRWKAEEDKKREAQRDAGQTLADLSTCASKNAITPSTWSAYTNKLTQRYYQCSLSTQNAAQFDTSVKARSYAVPPVIYSDWNELLIKAWPDDIPAQVPVQAFYYLRQNGGDFYEVRNWQFRYRQETGLWVPLILLNVNADNGKPFNYVPGDQGIKP